MSVRVQERGRGGAGRLHTAWAMDDWMMRRVVSPGPERHTEAKRTALRLPLPPTPRHLTFCQEMIHARVPILTARAAAAGYTPLPWPPSP